MNKCPICSTGMRDVFTAKLLNKYDVMYRQCNECGLLQTEEPYWLDEAYTDAISVADTGLVMRNFTLASRLAIVLYYYFERRGSYLDIAGGYGMLTRLMRDYGFDYYWNDKFCQNLLARGFEKNKAIKSFEALTAFEVLEHIYDPVAFIQENLNQHKCRSLLFTTELYMGPEPPRKEWWYYAFNTGQHISFFQRKTLEKIAEILGLNFYTLHGMHILTEKELHINPIQKLMAGRFAPLKAMFIRRKLGSLMLPDHFMLLDRAGDRGID